MSNDPCIFPACQHNGCRDGCAGNEKERAAFEAWGRAEGLEDKAIGRGMDYPLGKHLWRAWQAGRAALAAQQVPAGIPARSLPPDALVVPLAAAPQAPAVPTHLSMSAEEARTFQDWEGMDATTAFHLIERHADGWGDVATMMDAWLEANRKPHNAPPAPLTADDLREPKNGTAWRVEWWNERARLMLPADAKLDSFQSYCNGTLMFTIKKASAAGVKEPGQPAPQAPLTVRCKDKIANGGVCPHHNLHCGWPACNEDRK